MTAVLLLFGVSPNNLTQYLLLVGLIEASKVVE
jgi:hypothetical protein